MMVTVQQEIVADAEVVFHSVKERVFSRSENRQMLRAATVNPKLL